MNILITGAKGMLGSALQKTLSPKHTVHPFDIDKMDITDYAKSYSIAAGVKPDLIIHCAAYTDVDGCEKNEEKAYLINSTGTQNIALVCQKLDIPMVYISTDYVFDGAKNEPYLEFDKPNPLSVYGKSKYAGEAFVTFLLNKFYIIRTSWLFGYGGKNFVDTIINLTYEKDELCVVNDQVGCPTYASDLAGAISELIETPFFGIYHITNDGCCSWYEFAKSIITTAGIKGKKITPTETKNFPRPAKRPAYSVLKNNFLKLKGLKPLRHHKKALEEYLK